MTESLTKGTRVIVQGRLKQRSYETREGEKRTVVELDVDEIGPSLKFATASVNRASRGGSSGGSGNFGSSGSGNFGSGGSAQSAPEDPWGSSAPQTDPWGSGPVGATANGAADEPPF